MRRLLGASCLAVFAAACSPAQGVAPAKVTDPHEITLVSQFDGGALLFITATAGNELRVFNLNLPGNTIGLRDFVRAPNPLEPLSVPVVDQPVGVIHDVSYVPGFYSDGGPGGLLEVPGPYVFARGAGSEQISVVFNDQVAGLREVSRLVAPGVVTAMAAQYFPAGVVVPDGGTLGSALDGGAVVTQLYFATYDGTRAQLWRQNLPAPAPAPPDGGLSPVLGTLPPLDNVTNTDTDGGETIQALMIIPSTLELAVATHTPAGQGRTVALNLSTLASRPLGFPAPVRKFVSSPTSTLFRAGPRLFGLLDEASCGGQEGCRGIVSVDLDAGTVSLDENGLPMLPIDPGVGPIQSFSLMPNMVINQAYLLSSYQCPFDAGCSAPYELLGVGTTSGASGGASGSSGGLGGEIFFFDALRLHLLGSFDTFTDGGRAFGWNPTPILTNLDIVDGGPVLGQNFDAGLLGPSIALQEGSVRTENIYVTYQGTIPGMVGVETPGSDGGFFAADGVTVRLDPLGAPRQTVLPGDTFVMQGIPSGGDCPTTLTVSSVSVPPQTPGVSVTGVPSGCVGFNRFTIRAAAGTYAVVGTASGYLGRVNPNQAFAGGSYFYRAPSVFSPTGGMAVDAGAIPPAVTFQMGPQDPAVAQDFAYVIEVASNFHHFFFWPDPNIFTGGQGLPSGGLVPDDLVSYILGDPANGGVERTYVSYPARNGILEFDPRYVIPLTANTQNFFYFGG